MAYQNDDEEYSYSSLTGAGGTPGIPPIAYGSYQAPSAPVLFTQPTEGAQGDPQPPEFEFPHWPGTYVQEHPCAAPNFDPWAYQDAAASTSVQSGSMDGAIDQEISQGFAAAQGIALALQPDGQAALKRRRTSDAAGLDSSRIRSLAPQLAAPSQILPVAQPLPVVGPSAAEVLHYWKTHHDQQTNGRFIDEFSRFLHRHAQQHFDVSFEKQENGLPSLDLQMLMQAAQKEFRKNKREEPPNIPVDDNLVAFAQSQISQFLEDDINSLIPLLYPDLRKPLRPSFGLEPDPGPWDLLHNADVIREELKGILFDNAQEGVMKPTYEAAYLALGFGWDPLNLTNCSRRTGLLWSKEPEENIGTLATAGALSYHLMLCHQTGMWIPFPMRIAHYKPIRNALIQLLQGMLKLPAFVSRLRRLHRAGCYPIAITTRGLVEPSVKMPKFGL